MEYCSRGLGDTVDGGGGAGRYEILYSDSEINNPSGIIIYKRVESLLNTSIFVIQIRTKRKKIFENYMRMDII